MNQAAVKWGIFAFLAFVWGSSFILMKRALISFDFWQVGLLRILLATMVTLTFAFKAFRELRRNDLKYLITVGLFGNGLPYLLFPLAVTRVDSAVVGILNSMVPLFTVLIGLLVYAVRPLSNQYLGVVVGLLGASWLIAPWNASLQADEILYTTFPVLATIMYAISINVISQKLNHLSSNAITLLSFTTMAIPAFIALFAMTDFVEVMQQDETALRSLGYVAILGAVGTSLAVVLFNKLIKDTSPVFASSLTYCVPIVAIFWGWLDGESLQWRHATGVALILVGVYLVNSRRERSLWRGFRVR